MQDEDSFIVPAAPSSEPNNDNVHPCTICNRLLDAAHRIIDMNIQKRDHGAEIGQDSDDDEVSVSDIGSLSNILEPSSCERHQYFIRSTFGIHDEEDEEDLRCRQIEARWNTDEDRAVLSAVCTRWSANRDVSVEQSFSQEILLLHSEPHLSNLRCIGRPRDNDFISIDLIRHWISCCEMDHKKSCCVPSRPSIALSWLIDTEHLCLVPAEHCTRYIALSYVWGQAEMLKTTQKGLHSLQRVGALRTHLRVPRVIRHAISLASQLRQRYLWVDSLCIVQDDKNSLDLHIRHMASIFEAAMFTIVAADGMDAYHGILGIKGISEPRMLPPVLQLSKTLGIRSRGETDLFYSPWGRRGWTLQEYIFSKRKLIFIDGSVKWICQESRYFEDVYPESVSSCKKKLVRRYLLESVGELVPEYPMISQIEQLLKEYTKRDLTFGNDIIRAIEAVFTAHGKAYPSGFFLGLPLDFFDMALLWRHERSRDDCDYGPERRAAVTSDTRSPFPTWSWAGWVGELGLGVWRAATYIKDADEPAWDGKRCSTIPMLEWRCRSEIDGSDWPLPGQNNAYSYKLKYMGKEYGLPIGWKYEREPLQPIQKDTTTDDTTTDDTTTDDTKRDDTTKDDTKRDDEEVEDGATEEDAAKNDIYNKSQDTVIATPYYYSHDSAPGIKFWHPVPISVGLEERVTNPIHGRLLCASTRRGRLWVTTARSGSPVEVEVEDPNVDGLLVDIEGKIVGILWISDTEDRQLVVRYERQPNEAGYPCELVAISKGNVFACPLEPEKETFIFYNVLWIKWEDGIAYRRGVGRVKRKIWESMELEDVDLVLG